MTLRRPTWKDRKTGELRRSSCWYIRIRDAHGTTRDLPAFSSRARSLEYQRRVRALVDARIMREPLAPDLLPWLDGLPPEMLQRLVNLGLVDAARVAGAQPLVELVDRWEADLLARGCTAQHARKSAQRVRAALVDGCAFRTWPDVAAGAVLAYLARERGRGIGPATSNHLLTACKGFGRWLVREGLARGNQLEHVQPVRADVDVRVRRRALEPDEARRLLETARAGPTVLGVPGRERALLYRLALETGLRARELASLRVLNLDLAAAPPAVRLDAAASKRRRADVLTLRPALAAELAAHVAGRLPAARLLRAPAGLRWAEMLHADLAACRPPIAPRGPDGAVLDFHALRHSLATWLARGGVAPKVAQGIMRHSSVTLTLDRYAHVERREHAAALDALPDLVAPAGEVTA